jgi:4,5-dihydroxyphthalate decarboxylase
LLSTGELHAALVAGDPGYPGLFGGGTLPKAMGEFAGVRPLFDDSEEIIRWVRRTGIYPIIHLIAMKQEVAERYPDLLDKLLEAFREAKRLSKKHLTPEQIEGNEREKAALGEDPYAYVLGETEKRTMAALARYQIEQGLLKQAPPVESLFVRQAFAQ